MAKKKKNRPVLVLPRSPMKRVAAVATPEQVRAGYEAAASLAEKGDYPAARRAYEALRPGDDTALKALIHNDLAVLSAVAGDYPAAQARFRESLVLDTGCEAARANIAFFEDDTAATPAQQSPPDPVPAPTRTTIKVAVLSFLFNWPSTGGGNIHTAELVRFLTRAGYEVRHFFPRYAPWGIGGVEPSHPGQALDFDEPDWNATNIRSRFRAAIDEFRPDCVIIQDAWNFKPHLAAAMRGYPTFLRFQTLECLCPLNNIRLLPDGSGRPSQCPRHQLATPATCARCLQERSHQSGGLHRAERELAGMGRDGYHELLLQSLEDAEAVLVLNPFTEAMLGPYARRVEVVPWGMDPARFPRPNVEEETAAKPARVKRIFQAGLVEEYMKGFHILHAACELLWQKRQDFELVTTGDPKGQVDTFTRYTGWASQEVLPSLYRDSDIVVVPTIAQEGLSRTSVEAMAAGRPVVASRIGGIPFTVSDRATGLLCTPGDPVDLARKLAVLLDDEEMRRRMGKAGRRCFEEDFAWEVVIERYYRPLLSGLRKT